MATQYTKALAEYASKLRYEDLPREVVDQAKMLTLHTIGIALASYPTEQGTRAIALAKRMGGAPEATIFGDGAKVSCMSAGFANGTMVDALDWGDCSWTGHPSASVVPAALAVSEVTGATGKGLSHRGSRGIRGLPAHRHGRATIRRRDWLVKGWGLTTWQTFAATIPAAKLLKLDAQKTAAGDRYRRPRLADRESQAPRNDVRREALSVRANNEGRHHGRAAR